MMWTYVMPVIEVVVCAAYLYVMRTVYAVCACTDGAWDKLL